MHNRLKTIILLSLMTALVMSIGQLLGGSHGMKIAFLFAILMNLGAWWFSSSLVLAQSRARVVGPNDAPEIYQLVEHLAQRAGLPTPKVAIVNDPSPNAFATGRDPKHGVVAVTTGLLSILNREELAGVIAHELTHIKNRDILIGSVAAVMSGAIMILVDMARLSFFFTGGRNDGESNGSNPLVLLAMTILAPLAAAVVQAAISRSREYLADDGGADIAGTPYGLASALEKLSRPHAPQAHSNANMAHMYIVNPLNSRSLNNLFATHPPIEERIARLRGEII